MRGPQKLGPVLARVRPLERAARWLRRTGGDPGAWPAAADTADEPMALGQAGGDTTALTATAGAEEAATTAERLTRLTASGTAITASNGADWVRSAVEVALKALLGTEECHFVYVDHHGRPRDRRSADSATGCGAADPAHLAEAVASASLVRSGATPAGDAAGGTGGPAIYVPVVGRNGVLACLVARRPNRPFGPDEEGVASLIAGLAASAVEHFAGSEAYFQALIENAYDVTVVVDRDAQVTYVSPSIIKTLGREPAEMMGRPQVELVHPDDVGRLADEWSALLDDPFELRTAEIRFAHGNGSWRWMDLVLSNRLKEPDVGGIVINLRDGTERRQAQQELARAAERFRLAFDHAPIGMALIDQRRGADSTFLLANQSLATMLGRSVSDLVGVTVADLAHPDDAHVGRVARQAFEEGRSDVAQGDIRLLHASGRYIWTTFHAALIRDDSGRPDYFIGQVVDMTEQRAVEEHLLQQALHDPLTGLPNRRHIVDRLEQALARAARSETRVAALFLDLDRFKLVNDSFGHSTGDLVLVEVARRLKHLTRTSDTLGRLGGDEFVVLVEDLDDEDEARLIARRIEEAIARPMSLGSGLVASVTTSIGIAVARPGESPAAILRDADTALYRAKDLGRARCEVFDGQPQTHAVGRLDADRGLRAALQEDRFEVRYNPIVELRTGRVESVEAVLLLCDGDGQLTGPDEYAEVAEETGLSVALGEQLLRRACRQMATWREDGRPGPARLHMSVPPRLLLSPGLAASVAAVLDDTGVAPEQLVVQIAELAAGGSFEMCRPTLEQLRTLGVRTGIDHFGSGYTALTHLRSTPFDYLKIDPAFDRELGADPRDDAIVAAIVELARALSVTPVADGVESSRQAETLDRIGCPLAQGIYFGTLLPADEILVGDGPEEVHSGDAVAHRPPTGAPGEGLEPPT